MTGLTVSTILKCTVLMTVELGSSRGLRSELSLKGNPSTGTMRPERHSPAVTVRRPDRDGGRMPFIVMREDAMSKVSDERSFQYWKKVNERLGFDFL